MQSSEGKGKKIPLNGKYSQRNSSSSQVAMLGAQQWEVSNKRNDLRPLLPNYTHSQASLFPHAKGASVIQSLIFGWQSFWKFLSLTPNSYIWKSQQIDSFIAHKFQCLFSILPNSGFSLTTSSHYTNPQLLMGFILDTWC